jgi:uncharacterized protein (TIGR02246 family)
MAEPGVESAGDFVRRFLHAFERLDLAAFAACFADDATAFFPQPEPPERFDGRLAIAAQFERVFAGIRASATAGPPWHRLDAQDLAVQAVSDDVAIVSLHLRNASRLARRTLVLRRTGTGWRVAHLHASNVTLPA